MCGGRCQTCRHDAIGGTVAGELKCDVLQCSIVCHDRMSGGGRMARSHVIGLHPSTGRRASMKGLHAVECFMGAGWICGRPRTQGPRIPPKTPFHKRSAVGRGSRLVPLLSCIAMANAGVHEGAIHIRIYIRCRHDCMQVPLVHCYIYYR